MDTKVLLQRLADRLPELQWKLSALGSALSAKVLPSGLFRSDLEFNAANCINQIKEEIEQLAKRANDSCSYYLAERIQKKISVLVNLCRLEEKQEKTKAKIPFGLNQISTRQQWLQSLEKDIDLLSKQQQALAKTLAAMQERGNQDHSLQLKAELGEVERQLTLAKEAFSRV